MTKTLKVVSLENKLGYSITFQFFLMKLFGILYFGYCDLFDICDLKIEFFRISFLYKGLISPLSSKVAG